MALGLSEVLGRRQLGLGLDAAVAAEMHDLHIAIAQHSPHEQTPMAIRRVFFAAENGRTRLQGQAQQPLDPLAKGGRFGDPSVEHAAFLVVESFVLDAAAEHVAKKRVLDRSFGQRGTKRLAIELRGVTRIGACANVDHRLNAMLDEQIEKPRQRMVGMPDGPDRGWHGTDGMRTVRDAGSLREKEGKDALPKAFFRGDSTGRSELISFLSTGRRAGSGAAIKDAPTKKPGQRDEVG